MATIEMSATTVYWEKVEVPMKCRRSFPLHLKREVPSGMTPLPCVARIFPQRLVFPERQNLHSRHSGVLREGICQLVDPDQGFARLILECYDMVARFDRGDAFANGFNDTGALMAEDDGKGALGVFA